MEDRTIDTRYLSLQLLQTLSEDILRLDEVLASRPTVFFRPGDRTGEDHPAYWLADETGQSFIGFITKYGDHEKKIPPTLHEELVTVEVIERIAKPLGEVTANELQAAYADIDSTETLQSYLQAKYPKQTINQDAIVTIYRVRYSDRV